MGIALAAGLAWPRTVNSEPEPKEAGNGSVPKWVKVSVDPPSSHISFPAGNGSVIANAYCLICHSAGMVLRQPPLTQDEWTVEINKMRNSFGAPLLQQWRFLSSRRSVVRRSRNSRGILLIAPTPVEGALEESQSLPVLARLRSFG